jgi:hypothetical protein
MKLIKCNTCQHDGPRGCRHPQASTDAFWYRDSEPDDNGRPWCHSERDETKEKP